MASVTKRGNTYRIKVSCGYDISGKQIIKYTTWSPPPGMTARQEKKELERQKVLFEEKCRTGQVLDGSIRFADFVDIWMEDYAAQQLRPLTIEGYKQFLKRIIPALGHLRVDRIQPHHLQEFYKNLAETGVRADGKQRFAGDFTKLLKDNNLTQSKCSELVGVSITTLRQLAAHKNVSQQTAEKIASAFGFSVADMFEPDTPDAVLSANTILHYHKLISSILGTAVEWQVIFSNPCDRVRPPKVPYQEAVYLDDVQAARLLELLEDMPYEKFDFYVAFTVLLFTGLRRSELLGLRWSDIDMNTGVLTINKTSKYLVGTGIIEDDTKNSSSRRSFKIPPELIPLLREYHVWQQERRLRMGDRWEDSGRIFTTITGAPMRPDTLSSTFHRWIEKSDLPPVHLHSLRHTNATLLIANGTNIQTVSKRLGHSTSSTTSRVYAHAIQSADAAAAEAVPLFNNKIHTKIRAKKA